MSLDIATLRCYTSIFVGFILLLYIILRKGNKAGAHSQNLYFNVENDKSPFIRKDWRLDTADEFTSCVLCHSSASKSLVPDSFVLARSILFTSFGLLSMLWIWESTITHTLQMFSYWRKHENITQLMLSNISPFFLSVLILIVRVFVRNLISKPEISDYFEYH